MPFRKCFGHGQAQPTSDFAFDCDRPTLATIHPRDRRQILAQVAGDDRERDPAFMKQRQPGLALARQTEKTGVALQT